MSTSEEEPVPELEELLDSSRLAAAWQVALARAAEPVVTGRAVEAEAAEQAVPAEPPPEPPAPPAIPPPLPVAVAYGVLLDELARTFAAAGFTEAEERALAVPRAQLAAALDPIDGPLDGPLDGAAAEQALDELEDLLQSLMAPAGWPTVGED
jgi:hypothetical protein